MQIRQNLSSHKKKDMKENTQKCLLTTDVYMSDVLGESGSSLKSDSYILLNNSFKKFLAYRSDG